MSRGEVAAFCFLLLLQDRKRALKNNAGERGLTCVRWGQVGGRGLWPQCKPHQLPNFWPLPKNGSDPLLGLLIPQIESQFLNKKLPRIPLSFHWRKLNFNSMWENLCWQLGEEDLIFQMQILATFVFSFHRHSLRQKKQKQLFTHDTKQQAFFLPC